MASTVSRATSATDRPTTERPTHVRYWVIFFAVTLSIVTYIDRVALSLSRKQVAQDLGLSDQQMGLVFGAFALSYALFEVPSGWMGDKWGPRKVLMRIVIWWSAFTALTGMTWNFISLYVTQLFFGAGEAGCFPTSRGRSPTGCRSPNASGRRGSSGSARAGAVRLLPCWWDCCSAI